MSFAEDFTQHDGQGERWATAGAFPGAPLPEGQVRVLVALGVLCAELGSESALPAVADQAGMRRGAAAQSLQGLERRGYVTRHEHDGPTIWSLTLTGRSRATALAASLRI